MWTFEDEQALLEEILRTIKPPEGFLVLYDLDLFRKGIIKKFEFSNEENEQFNTELDKYIFGNKPHFYFHDHDQGAKLRYDSGTALFEYNREKREMKDWSDLRVRYPKLTLKQEMESLAFLLNHPPKTLPDC